MIGACGMGESLISIAAAGTGILSGGLVEKVLADKDARAELDALLASSRDAARAIVTEHGNVVEALRDALLERDELVGPEIIDIIAQSLAQTPDVRRALPHGPHRRRRTDVVAQIVSTETPGHEAGVSRTPGTRLA